MAYDLSRFRELSKNATISDKSRLSAKVNALIIGPINEEMEKMAAYGETCAYVSVPYYAINEVYFKLQKEGFGILIKGYGEDYGIVQITW